jgi:hypothetical protein
MAEISVTAKMSDYDNIFSLDTHSPGSDDPEDTEDEEA